MLSQWWNRLQSIPYGYWFSQSTDWIWNPLFRMKNGYIHLTENLTESRTQTESPTDAVTNIKCHCDSLVHSYTTVSEIPNSTIPENQKQIVTEMECHRDPFNHKTEVNSMFWLNHPDNEWLSHWKWLSPRSIRSQARNVLNFPSLTAWKIK